MEPTSFCLKWGIIGPGKAANDFCVGSRVLPSDEHRIVAVASRSLERAEKFAEVHNIEKKYGSYEELLKDEEVNIVYISTVTHTHRSLCLLALHHGKHVLCEKSLGVNTAEAADVIATARNKNLFLMEGMWSVFFPAWLEMKSIIKQGTIGKPKFINLILAGKGYALRPRFYDHSLCGGMINSMGVYGLLLAHVVFDGREPEIITAVGQNGETGVDKSSTITLKYNDGSMVNFITSNEIDYNSDAVIIGDKGNLRLQVPYYCATKLETVDGVYEFPLSEPELPTNFPNATGFSYEMDHVRQCLLNGRTESPVLTHNVTLQLLRQLDQIRSKLGVVYEQDDLQR